MPFGEIKLIPGVNVERTPTLNEAGISTSQLIRFKDSLVQKYGGFQKYYPFATGGVPRDLHAWQDLNADDHLAVGSTTQLSVISDGTLDNITPQTLSTDFKPLVIATALSTTITIVDPNIDTVTTFDAIYFETPVSVGGVVLSGVHPIVNVSGTSSFQIQVATAAATSNTLITNATSAAGTTLLNFTAVPAWVATGMLLAALATATAIPANAVVTSISGTQITISTAVVAPGISLGSAIVVVSLPRFTTTADSAVIAVQFDSHGLSAGETVVLPAATTASNVEIVGAYTVNSVPNASTFAITVGQQAASTLTVNMNSGLVGLFYYITLGPAPIGSGYGLGGYGLGGYGTGLTSAAQTGTPITATDWTSDNWGQLLLACPEGGGVYVYDPNGGFETAAFVSSAPPFNGGIFVSTSQQMLVCWASTATKDIGILQDPMVVRWSDVEDYTVFTPLNTNQAGSFRIPIGSKIMGGLATANQNLIWTDLDLWAMNYQGQPFVWGFNKIGAGAGLISSHAAQQLRGAVYWMGLRNFYVYDSSGVRVIPCQVWDAVFQNLNAAGLSNIRAMPNTPFNEVGWEYPSANSANGENDSYVKFNITEPNAPWDIGQLARSAWIDQTVLGMPIAAAPSGIIYQHETTNDADGQPLLASFTTGYFYLSPGQEFVFVDQILPDFKFGFYGQAETAQIFISINVVDYPGDTPTVLGPYLMTESTQYISVRLRGRQGSFTIASSDLGSWWRIGKVRYRYAQDGRR